jgi:hypothetical protein
MTMTLIETKTLGTAAASIEFTSIPQDGTDLYVLLSLRTATGGEADGIQFRFNSSTTDYSFRRFRGNGSEAVSDTAAALLWINSNTSTANTFSNVSVYIPNYAGSTNKSYSNDGVSENNATRAFQGLVAGLWADTSAITSISIANPAGGNLVTGSTVSLYKITKGSDGIVTTS